MHIVMKDYSFIVLFTASLICSLMIFTVVFFDGVQASNTRTIIKRYITNAALIDSSVAETIAGAESTCDGSSSPNVSLLNGSLISKMTSISGIVVAVCFIFHYRYRLRDNIAVFNAKEQAQVWTLVIPLIVEIIVYCFSLVNFKYYSNIYIVKLLKNMRIRADLQYLSDLWNRDQSKIESSGTNVNGVCASNCLPADERKVMVDKLRTYLETYNNMLDVDEWNNSTPNSFWSKISNLPSKVGMIFLITFIAIQCRFLWGMRIDNRTFALVVLGIVFVFTAYLFIIKDYLSAADLDSVSNTYKTIICSTGQDAMSTLLRRDLTDQSNYANDNL